MYRGYGIYDKVELTTGGRNGFCNRNLDFSFVRLLVICFNGLAA